MCLQALSVARRKTVYIIKTNSLGHEEPYHEIAIEIIIRKCTV
jgi:hypothetical protein